MFYYDHLRISRLIVLSSDAKVVFLTRCTLKVQSWTKHLQTFSLCSTISLHHKWNESRLLSPESECTSYPAVQPKAKFWRFLVKNHKKSAVKHSIEKPILLNFVNLSPTFVQDCSCILIAVFIYQCSQIPNHINNHNQTYMVSN